MQSIGKNEKPRVSPSLWRGSGGGAYNVLEIMRCLASPPPLEGVGGRCFLPILVYNIN